MNKFFRALKDPVRSCAIAWRRIFPFGIKPADPEAYRIGSWSYGKAQRTDLLALFPNASSTNIKIIRAGDRRKNLSLDAQELFALCVMVSVLGAKRIIEIGTSDGNTTVNLVANAGSGAAITTIDLPPDWKGEYSIAVPETLNNVTCRNEVGRQFRNTVYETSITQIFGDSAEIDFSVLGAPFDFAFIDGCHFYKYVRSDTEKCEQSMRDGGVIAWHDYGMIDDVSRAVDEWGAKRGVKVNVISATRLAFARLPKKKLESS